MREKMRVGDRVIAEWSDGLILSGTYRGTERGYIVLMSDDGKQIVCNIHQVKFRSQDESR